MQIVRARSPIGYEAVMILMSLELIFAFSVGITCIVFSVNMFRALTREGETSTYSSLPVGDFPLPPVSSSQNLIRNSSYVTAALSNGDYQYHSSANIGGDLSRIPDKPINISNVSSEFDLETTGANDNTTTAPIVDVTIWSTIQSFADYLRLW